MPLDATRSKFNSNQIDRLKHTESFTANGIDTDFTLTWEIYYSSTMDPLGSSEVTVFVNGLRAAKGGEAGGEYTLVASGGELKIIRFTVAPLSNHIITVEYRRVIPKT